MDLFLESFIFAIYVEYNLATKSKLDFINSFIFLSLIELIRKQKQKQKNEHLNTHTKSYLQKNHIYTIHVIRNQRNKKELHYTKIDLKISN